MVFVCQEKTGNRCGLGNDADDRRRRCDAQTRCDTATTAEGGVTRCEHTLRYGGRQPQKAVRRGVNTLRYGGRQPQKAVRRANLDNRRRRCDAQTRCYTVTTAEGGTCGGRECDMDGLRS